MLRGRGPVECGEHSPVEGAADGSDTAASLRSSLPSAGPAAFLSRCPTLPTSRDRSVILWTTRCTTSPSRWTRARAAIMGAARTMRRWVSKTFVQTTRLAIGELADQPEFVGQLGLDLLGDASGQRSLAPSQVSRFRVSCDPHLPVSARPQGLRQAPCDPASTAPTSRTGDASPPDMIALPAATSQP